MSKERVVVYSTLLALVVVGISFYSYRRFANTGLPENVVAQVVETRITADQFLAYMKLRGSATNSPDIKRQLLDELIEREAQITMARELGYDRDPEVVRAVENALIARLREEQLNRTLAGVEVTDEDISQYYQNNLSKYSTPAQKRAAIIRFDLPHNASDEQLAQLDEHASHIHGLAQTQPSSVRGFGALAAKYSYDQRSRYVGGDIGWYSKEAQELEPALKAALVKLDTVGEIAPVVRGTDALYLLKLIGQRDEVVTPLEVVAGNVRIQLLRQKQKSAEGEWIQSVVQQATPTIVNDSALSAITVSHPDQLAAARPPDLPK